MNKFSTIFLASILSGAITLIGYKLFIETDHVNTTNQTTTNLPSSNLQSQNLSLANLDFTTAAENTVHAVVHVKNLSYRTTPNNPLLEFFYGYQSGQTQAQVGMGSGVIISEDGYIVTNNHVIANASELEITLNNNETYKAKLIGTDTDMDIALLKIESPNKLPYIVFGDSDAIRLGEWVLAVGNPYNLTSTVTAGIISAKARNLATSGIQSFIQTDAVVNPGNSGGALVNSRGELIGINTMISSNTGSYVGYSFAVPSNVTRKIIEDILEFGNVQQGVLGVQGFELNTILSEELSLSTNQGFYVQNITKDSGADKTGIQQGDIIKKINNKTINTFVDIKSILNTKRPSDIVTLEVLRGNENLSFDVTLIKSENAVFDFNGFELENISQDQLQHLGLNYGVRIKKVTNRNYQKYQQELEGSILLTINKIKITNTNTANKILDNNSINSRYRLEVINNQGNLIRILL